MLAFTIFLAAAAVSVDARAVNLSSVWLLPEEGYPVFYRYFRDRITWYEAEAVCQFHHGQLLTVDTGNEFDAARAYLKELDVSHFVWTGLRRAGPNDKFFWPESKVMEHEGYWLQEIPKSNDAVCAAIDPASDYRWQPLPCSGPQAAAFICQMEVPKWAVDMCMVTSLPSLTVTFLPEQGAIELVSDCGFEGTRRIACKGTKKREELISELRCESSTTPSATTSQGWEETQTRQRRESQVTPDMEHTQAPTTSPVREETMTDNNRVPEVSPLTTEKVEYTSSQSPQTPAPTVTPEVTSKATTEQVTSRYPVPDSETVPAEDELTRKAQAQVHKAELAIRRDEERKAAAGVLRNTVEIVGGAESLSDAALAGAPADAHEQPRRAILISSKPIPPALGGNSPFLEPVPDNTTEDTAPEKESHESFNESPTEFVLKGNKTTGTPAPVSVSAGMEESGEVQEAANSTSEALQSELPERPNRGRLLVRPQHHSFFPYFLNRVLG